MTSALTKLGTNGTFQVWVEQNCKCSYRQAAKYMRIAKCASRGTFDINAGINAFLDAHAEHREAPKAAPSFTKDDAEYILKINDIWPGQKRRVRRI